MLIVHCDDMFDKHVSALLVATGAHVVKPRKVCLVVKIKRCCRRRSVLLHALGAAGDNVGCGQALDDEA
jgi:hypothetical protein